MRDHVRDRDQGTPAAEAATAEDTAADRAAVLRLSRAVVAREAGRVDEASPEARAIAQAGLDGNGGELPHRAAMEERFGRSFAGVQAHVGERAQAATGALGAVAYAYGEAVAFASPTPTVDTVAHELTHVVQHRRGGPREVAADEREAEQFAGVDIRPHAMTVEPVPALRLKRTEPEHEHAAGEAPAALLTDPQIASAIAFNEAHWKGDHKVEILGFLGGGGSFDRAAVLAIARIQREESDRAEDADGKLGKGTTATLIRRGLALSEVEVKASQVKLVFYPGEFEDIQKWQALKAQARADHAGDANFNEYRTVSRDAPPGHGSIYVEVGGNIVDRLEARGGPPVVLKDGTHTADPSKAGSYQLGAGKSHVTSAWMYSQIAWGAPIREHEGEIQFKNPGAEWTWATGPRCTLRYPFERANFEDGGGLMTEWKLNDFGKTAFQIQGSPGMYIHTTPPTEEATELNEDVQLTHSHGCLHVKPADRERLMARGYLQKGVTLVVKKYDEALDLGASNRP